MSILTDDCDIKTVHLQTMVGGNGDFYINLLEFSKTDGHWMNTATYRCAMSGGNAPTEVKTAIVALYRAMEAADLNKHPKADK